MIDKKRLLAIPNLKLAGIIENMNDEQMKEYERLLMAFIENFPGEEEKIKAALTENLNDGKNYDVLANNLTAVCVTLEKIHVDDLAKECRKQIIEIKGAGHEQIEAYVTVFLSSVAMLSIDIQMAMYLKTTVNVDKTMGALSANAEKIILAVDDAMFPLNMLKQILQSSPYDLVCVNSGKEALLYLKQHRPDLFILDIQMPTMDGYELAGKIRELGQNAPIIFLTGNATRVNVVKAVKAGASDFIVKPIDKKNFVYKISKYL